MMFDEAEFERTLEAASSNLDEDLRRLMAKEALVDKEASNTYLIGEPGPEIITFGEDGYVQPESD